MVTKPCPKCNDHIPVACKTCPCGHSFHKPVASRYTYTAPDASKGSADGKQANSSVSGAAPSRPTNDRPRRLSAMSSLYYHSSLHVSSYKLAKQAAAATAKKGLANRLLATPNQTASVTTSSAPATESAEQPKRKRGRPRLINRVTPPVTKERTTPDDSSSNSNDCDSKLSSSMAGRSSVSEESTNKAYQSLSEPRKRHFAYILAEINRKFCRNSNFPL